MQELLNDQANRIERTLAAQGLDVRIAGGAMGPRLTVFHAVEPAASLTEAGFTAWTRRLPWGWARRPAASVAPADTSPSRSPVATRPPSACWNWLVESQNEPAQLCWAWTKRTHP